MKHKKLLSLLIILLGLLVIPAVGRALTIDFDIAAPTAGTINYSILNGPLVGTGIAVDTVTDTDVVGPVYKLINGVLNFTTGNLTSTGVNQWNFGAGGSITLVGGVYDDANNNSAVDVGELKIGAGTTLLTGSFTSAMVTDLGNNFKIAGSTFTDEKDPALVRLFGGDPNQITAWAGNFNISFDAVGLPPNTFESRELFSGDVVNQVPEPTTMLLLGSGLLGLAGFARRRFKK